MNKDYLWDKTGRDPEIEKLENALQVFRYQETAPPELPVRVIPWQANRPRRKFSLVFAFAACTVFSMMMTSAWLQISSNKAGLENAVSETTPAGENFNFAEVKSITE